MKRFIEQETSTSSVWGRGGGGGCAGGFSAPSTAPWYQREVFARRAGAKEIADFTRSFAVMMSARLPLTRVLETAEAQCENERLAETLAQVRGDVEEGRALSESLAQHPKTFDRLYTHLVRVGEAAGILDAVLMQLADYLEKRAALRREIRLAMVYPGLVLTIALGAVVFLLSVVVPTFADLFADFGATLPAPTRAVMAVSDALATHGLVILLGSGLLALLARYVLKTPTGRRARSALALRVPLFGPLFKRSVSARFCRTLGTLLENGVALLEALEIQAGAASNVQVKEALEDMIRRVRRGADLAAPLEATGVFPAMVGQMIRVGEETAELDDMLLRAADHYEKDVESTVETLTSVLEPVMIVIIGAIIGGILVAMYLPMFDMVNAVQ